jgi:hypothetical protein
VYTGPSLRSLGSSLVLHVAVVAVLFNVPVPVAAPPLVTADASRPTEIRIAGRLYYVSQIQGSQATPRTNTPRAAPVAAATGRAAAPSLPFVAAPKLAVAPRAAPLPAAAAPAPLPEPARILRQQARAFIPPQLRPNPAATQTLIQPLAPLDVTPPPTPLPNFRITVDVSQMRRIPKPFVAPGRVTPATPPQSPDVETPAPELVPTIAAPPGEPLTIFSLSDHPIPFSDKVVVPAGNIAQPPGPPVVTAASGTNGAPGGISGGTAGGASGGTSGGSSPAVTGAGSPAATSPAGPSGGSSASSSAGSSTRSSANARAGAAADGTGRGAVGAGAGTALTGGVKTGDTIVIVGGTGGISGSTPGITPGAGTGTAGAGTGSGRTNTPGSVTVNRPPQGNFDAVVVQAAPTDQYPESRGLLTGRPIYSVYVPVGTAREWTLFYCVPGEKPEPGNGAVINLGPLGRPVKAPYPTKLVRPQITLPSWEKYVLVHGIVNKEGRFENLRVVRSIKPETDRSLLLSLSEWEFRAANREGAPIAVEFLLSIPARGL